MGRRNWSGSTPQRSRLIANREERTARAQRAFALYRPVSDESTQEIYKRLKSLQIEQSIPASVNLFNHDMHASVIPERRMRDGLLKSIAAGFATRTALASIERSLPEKGRSTVEAKITGADIIGRNRNILISRISDDNEVLGSSRRAIKRVMGDLGLKVTLDNYDHITGGKSKERLEYPTRVAVVHAVFETIMDIPIVLEPVHVEYAGHRMPLSEAKIVA